MKNLLTYLIFLLPMIAFCQTMVDKENKRIQIDLKIDTNSFETVVEKESYILNIKTADKKINSIKIERGSVEYNQLSMGSNKLTTSPEIINVIELNFQSNTIYTITIELEGDTTPRKYIFKSVSTWSWATTFGANAIFLTNPNSYKTVKSDTDKYTVTEFSSEKRIEYIPSLMFTFMDKSENLTYGFTGGLGFDLEQISVFSGISLGIGQNIILTGGMAFHKQDKLNSTYTVGQEVDTALTTENLTTKQYRFNTFVGISFRLYSNPFK